MISMKIDAGQSKISKTVLKQLGKNTDKVLADATNRALAGMRTDGTKLIVKESGIVRKKVFSSFTIIKASPSGAFQNARVDISGNPIGLAKFKHKPKKLMTGKTRGGVNVSIGQKSIKFKHAFVAVMSNGHVGIFERQRGQKTKSGREKLQELFGPAIPQFAGRRHITKIVQENAQERFIKRFEQQSQRWLKQSGVK